MYAADDDSSRLDRGGFRRRTSLPLLLLLFAGGYGLLVAALRLSPSFAALFPMHGEGGIPFLIQLALAFAGLAGLVLVLARAVRGIDAHPYASIAPVLAVFASLVHLGLRFDLPKSGMSSAYLAVSAIALALLGGALIARGPLGNQLFGWLLVVAPSVLVALMLSGGGDLRALSPALRVFLELLAASAALLGLAGVVARRLSRSSPHAQAHEFALSELESDVMRMPRAGGGRRFMQAVQMGVALLTVSLAAYWAVDRLKRSNGGAAQLASVAAGVAAGAVSPGLPVVEQLDTSRAASGAPQSKRQRASKHGDSTADALPEPAPVKIAPSFPVDARGSAREQNTVAARAPAHERPSKRGKHAAAPSKHAAAPNKHAAAPSKPAPQVAARTQGAAAPAWGADAMREFSDAKPAPASTSSKRGSVSAAAPAAPVAQATPAAPPTPVAKPTPAAPPAPPKSVPAWGDVTSTSTSSAALRAKPAKPAPIAAPAPPPKPEKPMTMDQLLDKVVEVSRTAQPQQKKGGGDTSKSQGDIDIDDLLNAAVKPKKGK